MVKDLTMENSVKRLKKKKYGFLSGPFLFKHWARTLCQHNMQKTFFMRNCLLHELTKKKKDLTNADRC